MFIINLNETKVYETKVRNLDMYMNQKIKKYFQTIYSLAVAEKQRYKMWEIISIGNAASSNIFIVKDEKMYYLNVAGNFEELKFGSKDLFTINRHSNKEFLECFRNCYADLKNYITNFREYWQESPIYCTELFVLTIDLREILNKRQEKFKNFIKNKENKFKDILGESLNNTLRDEIAAEITKIYKKEFLKNNNPILIIEIIKRNYKQQYVVLENLEVRKVLFSPIEKEIERTINNFILKDTYFFMNRIWNEIMMPSDQYIPRSVRVKEIRGYEIIATIDLKIGYGIILSRGAENLIVVEEFTAKRIFELIVYDPKVYKCITTEHLYVSEVDRNYFSYIKWFYFLNYIYIVKLSKNLRKYVKMLKGGRKKIYRIKGYYPFLDKKS